MVLIHFQFVALGRAKMSSYQKMKSVVSVWSQEKYFLVNQSYWNLKHLSKFVVCRSELCNVLLCTYCRIVFFNTIFFVSSHMYLENPEGTQVIVGSYEHGIWYISVIWRCILLLELATSQALADSVPDTCSVYLALHMTWSTVDSQDGRQLFEPSPITPHSSSHHFSTPPPHQACHPNSRTYD